MPPEIIPEAVPATPIVVAEDNLDKKFKFIDGVGVEFEGGWLERPAFTVHGDGSVCCEGDIRGESHTEPKNTLRGVFEELKLKYPDVVDSSCGMHIHISLPELYYAYLTSVQFWEHFLEKIPVMIESLAKSSRPVDYERFKSRFAGGNTYCKKDFMPTAQWYRTSKDSNRYTMLNFCYGVHKTMECRLFPMCESGNNARFIISEYINMVESFLENHKETITYRISPEVQDEDINGGKEEICV